MSQPVKLEDNPAVARETLWVVGKRSINRLAQSELVRRSLIYTGSSSINALTNFLLLPVLTIYLTPADYGIVETFLSVIAVLVGLVILGANTCISRDFFRLREEARAAYIGSALVVVVLGTTALSLIFGLLSILPWPGGQWLDFNRWILFAALAVSSARAVFTILQTTLQLEKGALTYAFFVNGNTIADLVISLILVMSAGMVWKGRVAGMLIAQLVSMWLGLLWLKKKRMLRMGDFQFVRTIIKSAPPLVFAHVAGWGLTMADRVIVAQCVDVQSTGIYGVGARFASVITAIGTAFSLAWLPFFYESIHEKNAKTDIRIVRVTYLAAMLMITGSFAYCFISPWVLNWIVDPRYFGAAQFIPILGAAYCVESIWKLFTGYLIYHGRLKTYSAILTGAAALNLVLDYIFIGQWGVIGAAWAAVCALGCGMAATMIAAQRTHPMPWLSFARVSNAVDATAAR